MRLICSCGMPPPVSATLTQTASVLSPVCNVSVPPVVIEMEQSGYRLSVRHEEERRRQFNAFLRTQHDLLPLMSPHLK